MKIVNWVHVVHSLDPRGGGPIAGIRMINAEMRKRGFDTEVVSSDRPGASFLKEYDFRIHALGPSLGGFGFNFRLPKWLANHAQDYNAVIVNGLWQYPGLATWRGLIGKPVPYFVFPHGMLDPWFKTAYPLKHLKKAMYWKVVEQRVIQHAKAVLFTSEEERLLARNSFSPYRCNDRVVSYGAASAPVNSDDLVHKFLAKFPSLEGKRVILFLGRVHEKKGCDLLIDAFSRIAELDQRLHLAIAGPDQMGWRSQLEERCRLLQVSDRVCWTGMLEGELKWGAYYACELFCLPSHQENFGIVVAEALACGRPVAISNKVNIWREVVSEGAGFVDDDSAEGTSRSLQKWLALTSETRSQMSHAARKCFESRFHIRKVVDDLLEIVGDGARNATSQ